MSNWSIMSASRAEEQVAGETHVTLSCWPVWVRQVSGHCCCSEHGELCLVHIPARAMGQHTFCKVQLYFIFPHPNKDGACTVSVTLIYIQLTWDLLCGAYSPIIIRIIYPNSRFYRWSKDVCVPYKCRKVNPGIHWHINTLFYLSYTIKYMFH